MWGHDRKWLASEDQAAARKLRLANAEKGMRQPVQVMDGNYHVMDGVCPWWDSVRKGQTGGGAGSSGCAGFSFVMAGPRPGYLSTPCLSSQRRGCPAQGRA